MKLIIGIIITILGFNIGVFAQDNPNIIIIFTDDQGYQDVGVFGSPLISTPNLDNMAKEGIKFTDFYAASSVCSPSRAALLTGAYPPRVGVPKVLWPNLPGGLSNEETTIANMLKTKNYVTACIGKWHLGDQQQYLPTSQGFDRYYGIPFSNDMSVNPNAKISQKIVFREDMTLDSLKEKKWRGGKVPLMNQDEIVEYPVNQSNITKRYTEQAINFITKNKNENFFLYLAHSMPHVPLYASENFKGKSKRGLYGDAVEEIDWSVGEILNTLKQQGLDENTLIIFTSDNGPWTSKGEQGGSALPLRGQKHETFEGGFRVPMIAQWKGKIAPSTVTDEVASTIDILPTLAYLTSADLPKEKIDGKNIWPLLSGKSNKKSPYNKGGFYYYLDSRLEAVRKGDWKLRIVEDNVALYNLKNDISEQHNLASEHPKIVKKLKKMMTNFDEELDQNKRNQQHLRTK
ncbi:sulfatase [Cellulophaga baltica]|uniref:sulfatase family protein n=1 Tax=Cellulophaga TaxID=104264 RepID=UPI001C07D434|nr:MULTISPECIES: sulfatase [Cellulophaga]MBU2997987.1 sulfatase [Cellulophaga baltica]MDO6769388.1 sulfatase [Cellulophaga sp. 1_MG-2023]